jgi:hypothetical protein
MTSGIFFEQYKLMVQSAENVSSRRDSTNRFFLSANTFLVLLGGFFTFFQITLGMYIIAIIGMWICFFWAISILSFKKLNSAKYKIIHKMEEKLPVKLYKDEWMLLQKMGYKELTWTEKFIPCSLFCLYFFGGLYALFI